MQSTAAYTEARMEGPSPSCWRKETASKGPVRWGFPQNYFGSDVSFPLEHTAVSWDTLGNFV